MHFSEAARTERIDDCWVRGADIVAVYAPTNEHQIHPEVYWRVLPAPATETGGLELIVSVHTSLLNAKPVTWVSSDVESDEVLHLPQATNSIVATTIKPGRETTTVERSAGCGLFVVRSKSAQYSYVEMVFPADFDAATLQFRAGMLQLQWRLFVDPLEKGVIRRARVQGWIVPRRDDVNAAVARYQEFVASELPLTT